MSFRKFISLLLFCTILSACAPATVQPIIFPTYDPYVKNTPSPNPSFPTVTITNTALPPTETREPTPTRVPVTFSPVFTPINGEVAFTPTPDASHVLPTPRQDSVQYVVQSGDTLGGIAV